MFRSFRLVCALALCGLVSAVCGAGFDGSGAKPLAIRGGTVYPITAEPIERGVVIVRKGLIEAVGAEGTVAIPPDAEILDATGLHVLPGFIDTHSHMGVYSWPGVEANSDGNEATAPVTAQVRAEDAINLDDPAFERARRGGITSCLIIPGSANIIGGEGVVVKLRPNMLVSGMKFKEAPRQIKMAMGENPKRVYGGRGELPSTRMGIVAKLREVFTKAKEYRDKKTRHADSLARYTKKKEAWDALPADKRATTDEPEKPEAPEHDALYETLVDVMEGRVRVQVHCYRKDDVLDIIRISDEFGFKIAALHHILEGYKVAEELAARGIGAVTWPDWWGFKMEAYDAVPQNLAIMANAGVLVAIHSDSADTVQRFYNEASKAEKWGMTDKQALESITINPAKVLGIEAHVGSLEAGKHADIAIMGGPPLDYYSLVRMTFIDGRQVFDRTEYEKQFEALEYEE